MRIEVVNKIPLKDLLDRISDVPLLKSDEDGNQIYPYRDANIALRNISPIEVNPTTFYLLRKNLQLQKELRAYLLSHHGIDSLNLDFGIELVNEQDEQWTLIPPIIEVTTRNVKYVPSFEEIQYDDTATIQVPIINDGAHRVALAMEERENFNAIYICGTMPEFPFYAHPNGWDRVKIVDEVPGAKEEKKFYSREDCYSLYRDFGVLGCGAPRKPGGED